jgi:hypothetical protein
MSFGGSFNHQSSCGFVSLPLTGFGGGRHGSGATHNDSPYIAALNRALQLEQTAVAIYAASQRNPGTTRSGATALDRTDHHHKALRHLIRLIFAQRGFPESAPGGITALTGTVAAKMSRYMPPVVQAPVLGVSAQRVEFALIRRYRHLLSLAPQADISTLELLLEQSQEFSAHS